MNPDFNLVFDMIKKIGHIIEDPNESFPWPSTLVFLDTLRTQRVAIACSEKKYFGISKVVLLGIAYAGPEDVFKSCEGHEVIVRARSPLKFCNLLRPII